MDVEIAFQQVEEVLKPWTRWSKRVQDNLLTISVSRNNLLECVVALRQAHWGYLSAITGLHLPGLENGADEETQWIKVATDTNVISGPPKLGESFVVLYHFCNGEATLDLRVHPPSMKDASVPSICSQIPSATLYERELQEMFGIRVEGTPNSDRLLLPDDWPDNVYPLRKQFTSLGSAGEGEGG
jgi:NADH:ubiquinone oxidoreductase subunit C